MIIGSTNQAMKLWKCQPPSTKLFGNSQWWCGDPWVTLPCTGDDAHFFNYSGGSALTPSVLPSAVDALAKSSALPSASSTHTSTNAAAPIFTTPGAASTNHSSNSAALSDQAQPQSSKMPIALGAGIGSALAIVFLGFCLVVFYMRRTKLNDRENSTSSSHETEKDDVDRSPMELVDTERPHELDSNGRNEMPGTGVRMVPDI